MAPQRPRTGVDDSRSETSSTKEKQSIAASSGVLKNRRGVSSNLNSSMNAPSKGDAAAKATTNGTSAIANPTAVDSISPMNWAEQPTSLLHAYRHTYRLQTPSAFTHPTSQSILSHGIGRHSPTMVASRRAKRALKALQATSSQLPQNSTTYDKDENGDRNGEKKRGFGGGKVPKEQLAMAVRKHFNAMGLNESETIVRFTYVGSHDQREFRQRFRPS